MCVLNQHLPPDRSVTTLMMVMHLSKHVISKHWTMASTLLQFFREFFSQAFSETIADEGGVVSIVFPLIDNSVYQFGSLVGDIIFFIVFPAS